MVVSRGADSAVIRRGLFVVGKEWQVFANILMPDKARLGVLAGGGLHHTALMARYSPSDDIQTIQGLNNNNRRYIMSPRTG